MTVYEYLEEKRYPGRIILAGTSRSHEAVLAYAIMGRSENSRNRIFVLEDGTLRTLPYDSAKVEDPSLIIYNAMRRYSDTTILTNGDQTDTIYDALSSGKQLEDALSCRTFEPDGPNYTPRISATLSEKDLSYTLSIIKRANDGSAERTIYRYPAKDSLVHVIHTYVDDGNPLPSFQGNPRPFLLEEDGIDEFSAALWNSLDEENRIALYVRIGGQERIVGKERENDRNS